MTDKFTLVEILEDIIDLFEAWKNGIFKDIGITWVNEPPAITKVRQLLKELND